MRRGRHSDHQDRVFESESVMLIGGSVILTLIVVIIVLKVLF